MTAGEPPGLLMSGCYACSARAGHQGAAGAGGAVPAEGTSQGGGGRECSGGAGNRSPGCRVAPRSWNPSWGEKRVPTVLSKSGAAFPMDASLQGHRVQGHAHTPGAEHGGAWDGSGEGVQPPLPTALQAHISLGPPGPHAKGGVVAAGALGSLDVSLQTH